MKLLKKLDDNILKILLVIFIFFIPLFPKFPFQVVNYTYIAIRIDDFLVALTAGVFAIQVIRGKIQLKNLKFKGPFIIFWLIVLASFLSGLYLTKTIEIPFVGLLHTARRVEYMIMFFIAMSVIRTVKDFKLLFYSLLASFFLITMYGLGQRFFSFPAISTMNPEFAKGRVLFLTPEARLSSTFAGHYDFGAFLVFMFPILWGVVFYSQKIVIEGKNKLLIFGAALLPVVLTMYSLAKASIDTATHEPVAGAFFSPINQLVLGSMLLAVTVYLAFYNKLYRKFLIPVIFVSIFALVLTASRTSSIAYLVSTLPFLFFIKKFRYFFLVLVVSLGMAYLGTDLVQRWTETIQIKQIIVNEKTGEQVVVQELRSDELPAGTTFMRTDKQQPESRESQLTRDRLIRMATLSGKIKNASEEGLTTREDYQSVTAVAADISIATRFEASWPRAIRAFLKNPLVGSGPSSITESSDGDYFRWLGETGALGFAMFLYIILAVLKYLFDQRKKLSETGQILIYGVIFGTLGLFVNAILIDIFEASKVAYLFWTILGMFVGLVNLKKKELKKF